ncbi:MAG TPA: energy transducer TonB [Opitutaceae bacterium]|nr:energy transducer TonB [Opitutaceae bacterium]
MSHPGLRVLISAPSFLLLLLLGVHLGAAPASSSGFRSDTLYFADTPGGRAAAEDVNKLFEGRQKTAIVADRAIPQPKPPVPRSQPRPLYPSEMKARNLEGTVTVKFVIGEAGSVVEAAVIGTTNPGFNEQALAAVRKWTFRPATVNGVPVRILLAVPLQFGLPKK